MIERALARLPADLAAPRAELTAALASELYAVDTERSLALAAEAVGLSAGVEDALVEARVLLRQCWAAWRPAGQPLRRAAAGDRLIELTSSGRLPERFRPLAHLTRFVAAYEIGDAAVADRHLALTRSTADPVRTPAEWTYLLYAESVPARGQGPLRRGPRPGRWRVRRHAPVAADGRRRDPDRAAGPGLRRAGRN